MAAKATGQRTIPHVHWNAPPRCAFFEIASPREPPTTMSRKIPAVVNPLTTTRRIATARTFQIGRVSCRSTARFTALITDDIAPLAAQTAPKKPIRNAAAEVPPFESFCRLVMNLITPFGAIGSRRRFTSSKRWKRPRAPTTNAIAGKNASSELYAICWDRPMQSSFMNSEKLRLSEASHSEAVSFSGEVGARPARASRSVAVDKAEAAELGLRLAFATAPEDQTCSGTDPSGQQKPDAERARRDDRKVGTNLRADVGRFADALAQRLGRARELLSFGFDVPPDLVHRARVPTGHRSSAPPSSASLHGWPAPVRAASPS